MNNIYHILLPLHCELDTRFTETKRPKAVKIVNDYVRHKKFCRNLQRSGQPDKAGTVPGYSAEDSRYRCHSPQLEARLQETAAYLPQVDCQCTQADRHSIQRISSLPLWIALLT